MILVSVNKSTPYVKEDFKLYLMFKCSRNAFKLKYCKFYLGDIFDFNLDNAERKYANSRCYFLNFHHTDPRGLQKFLFSVRCFEYVSIEIV